MGRYTSRHVRVFSPRDEFLVNIYRIETEILTWAGAFILYYLFYSFCVTVNSGAPVLRYCICYVVLCVRASCSNSNDIYVLNCPAFISVVPCPRPLSASTVAHAVWVWFLGTGYSATRANLLYCFDGTLFWNCDFCNICITVKMLSSVHEHQYPGTPKYRLHAFLKRIWIGCLDVTQQLHSGMYIPNSNDATLLLSLLPLPCLPFLTMVRSKTPEKFEIRDAHRWVLEQNQHLYKRGFLTLSCNFRISSKCACHIVKRWSPVRVLLL